jgi:hypothetical protein
LPTFSNAHLRNIRRIEGKNNLIHEPVFLILKLTKYH